MSSVCDYSGAYILVSGNISVENTSVEGTAENNTNKKATFEHFAPFTDCKREMNNNETTK